MGEFDQALQAFRRSAELDPDFLGAWTGIARVLLQREETEKALELLERLRAASGGAAHVMSLLQAACVQAGRLEEAAALGVDWSAKSSPGRDPWQAEFRPFQGKPLIERVREHLQASRARAAVELLEGFLAEGSEDWNAHGYLALCYFQLGRVDEARGTLEVALARDPDNALVLAVLAAVQEGSGERAAALATFERILVLDPVSREARAGRERLRGELGAEEHGR